ncbi:hypothetical protein AN964_18295 [Heyndrickxia shackletonii]|uniref:Uncharacterized protein n=1 Tax=Heyndrickxia shackletonii TaxID=157838 RepID=A0A0Q3X0E0_9BACI|nr:hypothetical protein [Heyndrickxia shackletonii]KQL55266.1 hypothetical protein AN964_18295 [Heyndrickxia shackletonii]MBB2483001.1 hypothetical protein [Bacillus sp. APMAM]NEY98797.1 hypothetical protein [Heyndrickxia shackletonii]RTZ53547.1 hypothetical protein EKO25_22690 [Bacillus sp. SAJ1]
MKKVITTIIIGVFFLTFSVNSASAHSGRTDRLGGHFRTSDCVYMFHHPTSKVSGKSKAKIVSLIKQYNSNYRCTRTLTTKKVLWNTVRHK